MGKIKFKLLLRKLKAIRINGFHGRRRPSPASISIESPRSLSKSSDQKPLSLIHADRFPKTTAESGFCLSPLNHKAIDIPFRASPKRGPLLLSPSRLSAAPIVLLNSPIAHPVSLRTLVPNRPSVSTVMVKNEASISSGCGCKAPLASSFRKAKENFQALSASTRSEKIDRHLSKRSYQKDERNKQGSTSKAAMEKTLEDTHIEGRKMKGKSSIGIESSCSLHEKKDRLESNVRHLIRPKDAHDVPSLTCNNTGGRGVLEGKKKVLERCNLRLSTSSGGATMDSGSFAWDKEYSSFNSDDNFFTSERGRASNSSISSSEFIERSDIFSFGAVLKEAREAGKISFDGWAVEPSKEQVGLTREEGEEAGRRSESFRGGRNMRSKVRSSPMSDYLKQEAEEMQLECDQSVRYPWLSLETSSSSFQASDLEAIAKAWAECVALDTSECVATEEAPKVESKSDTSVDECVQREGRRRQSKASRKGSSSCTRSRSQQQSGSENSSPNHIASLNSSKPKKASKKGNSTCTRRRSQQQSCSEDSSPNYATGKSKPTGKVAVSKQEIDPEDVDLKSLPSNVQGKVSDSMAVVKSSRDPYVDFRDSMVDMILEKQMFESTDLQELLQCFLSLNSLEHHDTIVRAFTEVWGKVFGSKATNPVLR